MTNYSMSIYKTYKNLFYFITDSLNTSRIKKNMEEYDLLLVKFSI